MRTRKAGGQYLATGAIRHSKRLGAQEVRRGENDARGEHSDPSATPVRCIAPRQGVNVGIGHRTHLSPKAHGLRWKVSPSRAQPQ